MVKPNGCAPDAADAISTVSKIAILAGTTVAVTFSNWLQERMSRNSGVAKESLVLIETGTYVVGSLVAAWLLGGTYQFKQCLNPRKYFVFMPVSLAFLAGNILAYTAIRGLGVSQYFLLSQLRVALSAIVLRIWKGVRQSSLEWIALLQLSVGLIVLIQLQPAAEPANTEISHNDSPTIKCSGADTSVAFMAITQHGMCWKKPYPWLPRGMCWGAPQTFNQTMEVNMARDDAAAVGAEVTISSDDGLLNAFLALAGILLSQTFAFIYMEAQLKKNQSDSCIVSRHHLNFFGGVASFGLYALNVGINFGKLLEGWNLGTLGYLMLCVTRGAMCPVVLKFFDSVVKGLTDIAAMVCVCILQIVVDRKPIDWPTAGLQLVLLLSVAMYLSARRLAAEANMAKDEVKAAHAKLDKLS